MPRTMMRAAIALGAVVFGAGVAGAQTQAGIARDQRTQQPLACLHVALVDAADRPVAHTVTDSAGRFMLEAPKPGAYRVRFESYGWAPLGGPIDTLEDGAFKQRAYPVAFSEMLVPSLPIDSAAFAAKTVNQRLDRRTIDSLFAPKRRFDDSKRALESSSAWKSRRLDAASIELRYPEEQFVQRQDGAAIVRFVVDSTGSARRDTWTVLQASQAAFADAARGLLDARWRPSTNAGRPVCDLVQLFVRYQLDLRVPTAAVAHVTLENE